MVAALVKDVVDGVELGDVDPVTEHHERVGLAVLDHGEEFLPVKVDRGLAVTDEANAALHEGTNVEVVGL